ncbi:MAG: flagellar biosynthesis protein FlhF [Butyrivibrio sp.]|nr:flagellar biosynthesis protein FlhF [Butyrivibrio sp.]
MIIKKFTARTEQEATEEAKKVLGNGIVIMNVRPVKNSGFFAFLKPQKVEVTVALEEENERTPIQPVIKPVIPSAPAPQVAPIKNLETDVRKADDSSIIEEKLDSLHSLLEQNIRQNEKEDIVEEEVKKGEEHHSEVTVGKNETSEEAISFIKVLYNTLLENEVDEKYANQLTDEIEKVTKANTPLQYALENVYQKMVLKFGKTETITPSDSGVKAEVFIGPTGVGKTTTIAKLASQLYLTQKKKVALVTIDTYRIAAAEQLRTYASILEIPFRVIYSIDEMKQAAEDFKDYDYLMVDTAGHPLHDVAQRENTKKFIDTLSELMDIENFLVLSATTKYRDLTEICDCYAEMVSYKLIFTKMDETAAAGNLYNIRMRTGAAMSYITNGQNVPDDIAVFDAQKIVKGLLGGHNR